MLRNLPVIPNHMQSLSFGFNITANSFIASQTYCFLPVLKKYHLFF